MLPDKPTTAHQKLIADFAEMLLGHGYIVCCNYATGNKLVDLFAIKDDLRFTLEVVSSHYSGPLEKIELVELLAVTPQESDAQNYQTRLPGSARKFKAREWLEQGNWMKTFPLG